VVLQRRGGGGSSMAVVCPVRCSLHLSVPYRRRVTPRGSRRLHKCGYFGGCCGLWFLLCLLHGVISDQARVVRLVSLPQSDQPELLSSVEFDVCLCPNPTCRCYFCGFLLPGYGLLGYNLIFFCYTSRNTLIECCLKKQMQS
jgi:hypothetical protein